MLYRNTVAVQLRRDFLAQVDFAVAVAVSRVGLLGTELGDGRREARQNVLGNRHGRVANAQRNERRAVRVLL